MQERAKARLRTPYCGGSQKEGLELQVGHVRIDKGWKLVLSLMEGRGTIRCGTKSFPYDPSGQREESVAAESLLMQVHL